MGPPGSCTTTVFCFAMSQSSPIHNGDAKCLGERPLLIAANIESITGGKVDAIKPRGPRNSLLDVYTHFPPEILGYIFKWTVARVQDDSPISDSTFNGLERGSYNFLFVCHRWFEVASDTPELWRFWGNNLQDWKKLCRFNRKVPVDLVLDERAGGPKVLGTSLQDELRDRATRDKIRQIHLKSEDLHLAGSILSSLTPDGESTQEIKSIESIIFHTSAVPETLNFFARSRLPRLQRLEITGHGVSRKPWWDHLTSQTTRLTVLSLHLTPPSLPIPTSQLNSILLGNPNLEHLALSDSSLPDDDEPRVRVPLRDLKTITFSGEFRSVFRLLQRLEFPVKLECMDLHMENATFEDVRQTFGPFVGGFFRRGVWFQDELDVMNSVHRDVVVYVGSRVDDHPRVASMSGLGPPSARFSISVTDRPPDLELKKLTLELMAFIPRKHVECLEMEHTLGVSEELFIAMPSLRTLWLRGVTLSDGFLQPNQEGPRTDRKPLSSLRSLTLNDVTVEDGNWRPLIKYLQDRTADDEALCLSVVSKSEMPPEVEGEIRGLVRELEYTLQACGSREPSVEHT